jgi:hypothetical protein
MPIQRHIHKYKLPHHIYQREVMPQHLQVGLEQFSAAHVDQSLDSISISQANLSNPKHIILNRNAMEARIEILRRCAPQNDIDGDFCQEF